MTWPAGVATTIVTHAYFGADGSPCTGQVDFVLSLPVDSSAPPLSVFPRAVTAEIGKAAPGLIAIQLARNDNPGFLPAGTSYTVTERIDQWGTRERTIQLTSALGASVDLSEFPLS
jgi:hypothetical protein